LLRAPARIRPDAVEYLTGRRMPELARVRCGRAALVGQDLSRRLYELCVDERAPPLLEHVCHAGEKIAAARAGLRPGARVRFAWPHGAHVRLLGEHHAAHRGPLAAPAPALIH